MVQRVAILHTIFSHDGKLRIYKNEPDPLFYRRCLTYFDRIEYPFDEHLNVPMKEKANTVLLESLGVLSRPKVSPIPKAADRPGYLTKHYDADTHEETMLRYLRSRMQNVTDAEYSLVVPISNKEPDVVDHKSALIIKMEQLLPIPIENASFENIMKFKKEYSGEFQAFHEYLDDLYRETLCFVNKGNYQLQLNKASQKLKTALDDLEKAFTGKSIQFVKEFRTTGSLNLGKPIAAGAAAGIATGSLTVAAGTALAMTIPQIVDVSIGSASKRMHPVHAQNLSYAVAVRNTFSSTTRAGTNPVLESI